MCVSEHNSNKRGSALLITMLLLLMLTMIASTCLNVSGIQFKLTMVERNANNTYYLAKSALEKHVDTINKATELQLSYIVSEIAQTYIDRLSLKDELPEQKLEIATRGIRTTDGSFAEPYKNLQYIGEKFQIKPEVLAQEVKTKLHLFIKEQYIGQVGRPIVFKYQVQSDREKVGDITQVEVRMKEYIEDGAVTKCKYLLTAVSVTKQGIEKQNQQKMQTIITLNLPNNGGNEYIENELHEAYEWAYNPSELLDDGLVCFSDLMVGEGSKLIVNGNMLVRGSSYLRTSNYLTEEVLEPDQIGGIIANNGGQIEVYGNLYTCSGVMVSNGWENTPNPIQYNKSSSITVSEDIIAHSIAVVDDSYEGGRNHRVDDDYKVKNVKINVGGNAFVENDVRIDSNVTCIGNIEPYITIGESIFGIGDGNGPDTYPDPTLSSGVFAINENTQIQTRGAFVIGQAYYLGSTRGRISGFYPAKLYESVGAPFAGVGSLTDYDGSEAHIQGNSDYLASASPYIISNLVKKSQVIIEDMRYCYAPEAISANGQIYNQPTEDSSVKINPIMHEELANSNKAKGMMYKGDVPSGGSARDLFNECIEHKDEYSLEVFNRDENFNDFYDGNISCAGKEGHYNKILSEGACTPTDYHHLGIQGYMTLRRSTFYNKFNPAVGNIAYPELLNFEDVVNETAFEEKVAWSYDSPILIFEGGNPEVDISDFYVQDDGGTEVPVPTIIVYTGNNVLKLRADATSKNRFCGIVISSGKVEISSDMEIIGSMIVGGTDSIHQPPIDRVEIMRGTTCNLQITTGKTLTITSDSNMLFKVKDRNKKSYRQVLDGLKLTQYNSGDLWEIIKPYEDEIIAYTVGKLFMTEESYFTVYTDYIQFKTGTIKKVDI